MLFNPANIGITCSLTFQCQPKYGLQDTSKVLQIPPRLSTLCSQCRNENTRSFIARAKQANDSGLSALQHKRSRTPNRAYLASSSKSKTTIQISLYNMLWYTLATSTTLAALTLSRRVSAAPVALLGGLSGQDQSVPSVPTTDKSSPGYTKSKPYAYHTCPNGGTWTRFEDDFTTFQDSDWIIETGAKGVKTDQGGMTLTLDRDMVDSAISLVSTDIG